jgi:hypothetical protein
MHTTPELYIHIWPFKLFARGKEALQTVRWPVRFMLFGVGACLLAIALWYGSKAYSLYSVNTADKTPLAPKVLHLVTEYFFLL